MIHAASRRAAPCRPTAGRAGLKTDLGIVLATLRDPRQRDRAVARLAELVRLPSVSGDPAHRGDMNRTARHLAGLLRAIGLRQVRLLDGGGGAAPSVYGEWKVGAELPTVLFYAHYDVQPPGPSGPWRCPPFAACVVGGYLHGRGASDDKGQLLTHLGGIEAWLQATGTLPLNVKVWLDGEEEIGSPNLATFLAENRQRLACDAVVVSDTQMFGAHAPSIVYGLRGLVAAEIEIRRAGHDVHDGLLGGATPNPVHELARVLDRLHDEDGQVTLAGFYDRVRPVAPAERAELDGDLRSAAHPALVAGAGRGGRGRSPAERIALRPALNVTMVRGGVVGPRSAAIVPSVATARVNVRLVPDQDPVVVAAALRRLVASLVRPPLRARVVVRASVDPVVLTRRNPFPEAARRAASAAFGAPARWARSGGTIPAVSAISSCLPVPVVLVGFGLPDDRVHGPNERFLLANLHRGTETIARLLAECAG